MALLFLCILGFPAACSRPAVAATPAAERAQVLHRWAEESLPRDDAESRARARRWIDEAIQLEPGEGRHWRVLARLQELQRFDRQAIGAYRRAVALSPGDPEGWLGLAGAEQRLFLRTLDTTHVAAAMAALDSVTRLRPHGGDAWLRLVALRYEARDLPGATVAARRALGGTPRRPEAEIAAAYTAYRTGDIELADSLFRVGIPRLSPELRAMFSGPRRPGVDTTETDAPDDASELNTVARAGVSPGALRSEDPDPTTTANEALLEWWSRVAHAVLLFEDPLRPGLDARADTYIRYGPPTRVELDPAGVPLYFKANLQDRGSLAEYPLRVQLWSYPELGMRVLLQDRSLAGHWTEPVRRFAEWPNLPSPGVLAARPDLLALGDGYVVIPTLAPASQRLDVSGALTRFESEAGPRLRGQLDIDAPSGETLVAEWAVRDAKGRTVARGAARPRTSACDPGSRRVAEFLTALPPGRYDVTMSARSARRRGFARDTFRVEPSAPGLAMSDLLVNCGSAAMLASGDAVRLEEAPGHRFPLGAELAVYMEIHRLAPGEDGLSRFEYDWSVHRGSEGGSADPLLAWASRTEVVSGGTRRQFVAVNTAKLTTGRYHVQMRVRDLTAGTSVVRSAAFTLE